MNTNAIRFAAGVALLAFSAPFPAYGQFFSNYPVIIVPPPAQEYVMPKPATKPTPDKPKPADTPAQAAPTPSGHYQGRTFVPDKP
jgi:hypothetical protein